MSGNSLGASPLGGPEGPKVNGENDISTGCMKHTGTPAKESNRTLIAFYYFFRFFYRKVFFVAIVVNDSIEWMVV